MESTFRSRDTLKDVTFLGVELLTPNLQRIVCFLQIILIIYFFVLSLSLLDNHQQSVELTLELTTDGKSWEI